MKPAEPSASERETIRAVLGPPLYVTLILLLGLAYLPLAWWSAIVASALGVYLRTGSWPGHGGAGATVVATPLWVEYTVFVLTVVLLTCLSISLFRRSLRKLHWLVAGLATLFLAWFASLLLFRMDPGGVLYWALD